MTIRIFVLISLCLLTTPATAQQMNADEEAVWALEEAYFVYVENNDIDGYKTLWDERFVGWPGGTLTTAEKSNIADWIAKLHDEVSNPKFEITKHAVRSFGDIVVTHYNFTLYSIDPETGNSILVEDEYWSAKKITHTWRRNGDTWQIITGMAGDYPPSED